MTDEVEAEMAWHEEPGLTVNGAGDTIRVSFDPRLSEAQVLAACAAMGDDGERVLQAWRRSVGITGSGPAT